MGFDLSRFIGEIDEEFQCCICKMVLENPVQTPCDHLFCSECMKGWLSIDKSCPVDRQQLAKTDLKPVYRSHRNLLNKLDIKCDFDSEGCRAVVKLEGIQGHIASCEYNPNALIVCDKGCNLQMSRRKYRTSNSCTHLSMFHKKQIASLIKELSNQEYKIGRLCREKDLLEGVTNRQESKIRKLSDEVNQLRQQQNQLQASMQQQKQEIANFIKRTEISWKAPMQWEKWGNIKSPSDQPDVLEVGDESRWGRVRSFQPLEPDNSSFKIQVLSGDDFYVGFSFKAITNDQLGRWFADYYGRYGSLDINNVEEYRRSQCIFGDIIELGARFPLNFVNDGNASVEFYLSIHGRVVKEKVIKMPIDAVYPTIQIFDNTKIKYFGH